VTVAVLEEPKEHEVEILKSDLEESFVRGSGAGGQHRNKTDTAVQLKHKPSGILVRVDGGRSQYANRMTALCVLRAKLKARLEEAGSSSLEKRRRSQVGSGMRGDKRRTIAVQRDDVADHVTGKSISFKDYQRGKLKKLVG
jgi:peptide chain release factor 1